MPALSSAVPAAVMVGSAAQAVLLFCHFTEALARMPISLRMFGVFETGNCLKVGKQEGPAGTASS